MRDVAGLLWVLFLIVGVVGSIVQSVRKQAAAREAQRVPQQPAPQQQAQRPPPVAAPAPVQRAQVSSLVSQLRTLLPPQAVAPPPVAAAPPPPPPRPPTPDAPRAEPPPSRPPAGARLFGTRSGLVRAVIAAEVLGKPHALRDE